MTQLQPECMVINGFYQYRPNSDTVGTQRIRIDLIPCKGTLPCCYRKLLQALPDALGETRQTMLLTKHLYPAAPAIGNNTQLYLRIQHHLEPRCHLRCWRICRIWYNRIVKIQHQQPNAVLLQKLRRQVCDRICQQHRQQRKIHKGVPTFIECIKSMFVYFGYCTMKGGICLRLSRFILL